MTDWVTENLPESEIKQFNDNIGQDNETALFTIKVCMLVSVKLKNQL